MKWFLIFATIALTVGGTHGDDSGSSILTDPYQNNLNSQGLQPQQSAQVYHYQHYPESSGYYSNNYNNYPAAYVQKQDLFGGGNNLLGGDQGGDGDIGGAIGGVVAAIAALLGLKGLTKLGAAALFIFIFVIIPLFIVPIVLSIAAIALAATDSNGGGGGAGMLDKMKDWLGGNKRAMSAFDTFLSSEDCIERISCSIGKSVFSDGYSRYVLKGTKANSQSNSHSETKANEESSTEKPGLLTRVARGLKAENCVSYKCSIMPRFS